MRKCLEIVERHGFGLGIQTKSDSVLRDADVLEAIERKTRCFVQMTLTTFDEKICKTVEPNVSTTFERYRALKEFQKRKVPTVVWLSPLLPFINDTDENLRGILDYCFDADVKGIVYFGAGLTLREGNREYFYQNLDKYFPGLKERYQKTYGYSYEAMSPNNAKLTEILTEECEKRGVLCKVRDCFRYISELPKKNDGQISFLE